MIGSFTGILGHSNWEVQNQKNKKKAYQVHFGWDGLPLYWKPCFDTMPSSYSIKRWVFIYTNFFVFIALQCNCLQSSVGGERGGETEGGGGSVCINLYKCLEQREIREKTTKKVRSMFPWLNISQGHIKLGLWCCGSAGENTRWSGCQVCLQVTPSHITAHTESPTIELSGCAKVPGNTMPAACK